MRKRQCRVRLLLAGMLVCALLGAGFQVASARPYWTTRFAFQSFPTTQTALTIDSQGQPFLAFFARQSAPGAPTGPTLTYTKNSDPGRCNCLFNSNIGDADKTSGIALALDASDRPHIAYHDSETNQLEYFYPNGATFSTSGSGINGIYPSMVLDDVGVAWMSFYDQATGSLYYAHIGSDLVWHIQTVAASIEPTWSSIILAGNRTPYISYYDSTTQQLKAVGYPSESDANRSIIDNTPGAGVYSSFVRDSAGNAHVAYWDATNHQLKYASTSDGSHWSVEIVQSDVTIGTSVSLAFDPDDHPHMVYLDVSKQLLQYVSYDGSDWSTMDVSKSINTGNTPDPFSTLAIDSAGKPYIAYLENNATVLELATLSDDSTAPTISGAPRVSANSNGWYNADVPIHWTCADEGGSGVNSCGPDATITTEGTGLQLNGTATDNAGNSSSATSSPPVNIDKTGPTITGGPTTSPNSEGWYTSPVPIDWNCGDTLSGIASCTQDSTVRTEGADQTVTGTAVDRAGNSAQQSATFSVDLTGPTLSGEPLESPNTHGWFKAPVTIIWTCADSVSQVASCQGAQTVGTDGADQTTSGSATNGAGLAATAVSKPFSIDQVAPSISGTPSGQLGLNGWYTEPVTMTWNCSDALSGIDTCSTPNTLSSDGTGQTASGTAVDKAGNSTTRVSPAVNIDQTSPVVTYSGNQARYGIADTIDIRCSASDALSGLASNTCPGVSGPALNFGTGLNQFSTTVTDRAGNETTATVSFTVTVTASDLCALTKEYVNNARLGNQLCAPLTLAQMGEMLHNPRMKASAINSYILLVRTQRGRGLTFAEANTLMTLARQL